LKSSSITSEKNNPIIKHLLKDPIETKIMFIDTSAIASAIFGCPKSQKKQATVEFFERLRKEKISLAFSSVLYDEFMVVAIDNETEKSLLGSKSGRRKQILNNPELLLPHLADINKSVKILYDILSKFQGRNFAIFPTEPTVAKKILEVKSTYKLELADAIHIGTMLEGNQKNFASFDEDFKQIKGINLWWRYYGK